MFAGRRERQERLAKVASWVEAMGSAARNLAADPSAENVAAARKVLEDEEMRSESRMAVRDWADPPPQVRELGSAQDQLVSQLRSIRSEKQQQNALPELATTDAESIEQVRLFAQSRAITARATGRDWLDLLAIIERANLDQEG